MERQTPSDSGQWSHVVLSDTTGISFGDQVTGGKSQTA